MKGELVAKGSVKDIYKWTSNLLLFDFSDRYSVFDWGEMPDLLEGKGQSLALMGKVLFLLLEKRVEHHFVDWRPPKCLVVKSFQRPTYTNADCYKVYQKNIENIVLPLEVVFRWGVPEGSSYLERSQFEVGTIFSEPVIEFFTKFEPIDCYLTDSQAQEMSGLSHKEWEHLKDNTKYVALELREVFKNISLELWDGKIEWALGPKRDLVLVDSIGLDELRLSYKNKQISKEFLRQYYRTTDWYREIIQLKKKSADWKKMALEKKITPPPLPDTLRIKAEEFYSKIAHALENSLQGHPLQADYKNFLEEF